MASVVFKESMIGPCLLLLDLSVSMYGRPFSWDISSYTPEYLSETYHTVTNVLSCVHQNRQSNLHGFQSHETLTELVLDVKSF